MKKTEFLKQPDAEAGIIKEKKSDSRSIPTREREISYKILNDIDKRQAYSNIAINNRLAEAKDISESFVRRLVYGVLENRNLLDYYILQLVHSRSRRVGHEEKNILRVALYQLEYLNSVPDHAAINEAVNLAKKFTPGRDKFINAILRSYLRQRNSLASKLEELKEEDYIEYLHIKYSYDRQIVELWAETFGIENIENMLASGNERADICLRTNLKLSERDELMRKLTESGYEVRKSAISKTALAVDGEGVTSSDEYKRGMFSIQDEASQLMIDMIAPDSGQRILDLCAAPGGKSFALAERLDAEGSVTSCDIYEKKLMKMKEEAVRLGIADIVKIQQNDALKYKPDFERRFDIVIADVPCTGLGVIRRRPEIKYKQIEFKKDGSKPKYKGRQKAADIEQLIEKQRTILENASAYVREGGKLYYSTCTINPSENEDAVRDFLSKHGEYSLIEERQLTFDKEGCDGFYIAALRKDFYA